MRSLRGAAVAVMLVISAAAVSACGGGSSPSASMPSVTGERLDLAYSDLSAAGVGHDDVEIVGGGTFGVLDESNWIVCEQRPSAGAAAVSVRLVVDRSCPGMTSDSGGTSAGGAGAGGSMPSVVGMVLQDAQDLLQSQGSYLMDQQDASGQGRMQVLDSNWTVCSQSPAPGAALDGGTLVTLSAVKIGESCP